MLLFVELDRVDAAAVEIVAVYLRVVARGFRKRIGAFKRRQLSPGDLGLRCPVLGFPGELLEVDLDRRGLLDCRSRSGGVCSALLFSIAAINCR